MNNFKNILLGVFVIAFIFSILVFGGVINIGGSNTQQQQVNLAIWGPFTNDTMADFVNNYNSNNSNVNLTYTYVNPDTVHTTLTEAIANGKSPDIVIFSNKNVFQDINKLYVTPFTGYPERTYRDTYIDGAGAFLNDKGILLYPLVVDPMVVYYNKDIVAGQGFIVPPNTWDSLSQSIHLFLKRDIKGSIIQSPIALGESTNVPYFKNILSSLFLQAGNNIVSFNINDGKYQEIIDMAASQDSNNASLAENALTYITSFSNPTNSLYSWNKSLPTALDSFVSGQSVFYIAPASELFTIQQKNPNINFDVLQIFQPKNQNRAITYGDFYGVGIIKNSKNVNTAYLTTQTMTGPDFVDYLSKKLSLPPARRDLLLKTPSDAYMSLFFKSALQSFTWIDPNTTKTNQIFADMMKNISSGAWQPSEALYNSGLSLNSLIKGY